MPVNATAAHASYRRYYAVGGTASAGRVFMKMRLNTQQLGQLAYFVS